MRELFVQRPGFMDAELIAAFAVIDGRFSSGTWPDTSAAAMNTVAATNGASAFVDVSPPPYLLPRAP